MVSGDDFRNTSESHNAADIWRQHALNIVRTGMFAARDYLDRLIVADRDDVPGIVTSFAGHGGSDPTALDVVVKDAIKKAIQGFNQHVAVLSEEQREPYLIQDRQVFALLDEVDGTTSAHTWLGGHACVIGFFQFRSQQKRLRLLAAAIATSTGHVISWTRHGHVHIGWWTEPPRPDGLLPMLPFSEPHQGTADRIASNATSHERRTLLLEQFDLSGLWVLTAGGNPILPALLLGELEGVIEVKENSAHDVLYLHVLERLGLTVFGHDAKPLDVESYFAQLLNQRDRKFPPFVVAKEAEVALELLARKRV